jgi:signal transduction histidine kinase
MSEAAGGPRGPASGIRRKIWVAFILQVAAISFATVLGVYGASAVLKDVLIQRALYDEAGHYWDRRQYHPDAPLPDTYNMRGYLVGSAADEDDLPAHLRGLGLGYHSLPAASGGALVLVEHGPGGRLILEFKQEQVAKLAFFFGFVPLAIVLMVIYVIAWFTYRLSRRAVSPIIWLASEVGRWDPKSPNSAALSPESLPLDVEGEVAVLANALHALGERVGRFVERERNFTRDASHELRTPLTVIQMACDLLLTDCRLDEAAARSVQRIKGATRDMAALIEAFLILAREGDTGLPQEDFLANDVAVEEAEKIRPLLADKPVELDVRHEAMFSVHGSSRALSVIVANLLRNACLYTDRGHVTVIVSAGQIVVEDSGPGMGADELARVFEPFFRGGERKRDGHGIGLSIVRRLSERFGWPVTLESTPGVGTRAIVRFPSYTAVDHAD